MKCLLPLLAVCCVYFKVQPSSGDLDLKKLFNNKKMDQETEKDYQFRLAKQMAERLYGEEVVNRSLSNIYDNYGEERVRRSIEKHQVGNTQRSLSEKEVTHNKGGGAKTVPSVQRRQHRAAKGLSDQKSVGLSRIADQVSFGDDSDGMEVKTVLPNIPIAGEFARLSIEDEKSSDKKMQNIDSVIDSIYGAAGSTLRKELGLVRKQGVVKSNPVGAVEETRMAQAVSYITNCVRSTLKEAMSPQPCVPLTNELQMFLAWMMHGPEGNSVCPAGVTEFRKYPYYLFHENRHIFDGGNLHFDGYSAMKVKKNNDLGKQAFSKNERDPSLSSYNREKLNNYILHKDDQDINDLPVDKSLLRPQRSVKKSMSEKCSSIGIKKNDNHVLNLPKYFLGNNKKIISSEVDDDFDSKYKLSKRDTSNETVNQSFDTTMPEKPFVTNAQYLISEEKKRKHNYYADISEEKRKPSGCGTLKKKKHPSCCPTVKNWQTLMTESGFESSSEELERLMSGPEEKNENVSDKLTIELGGTTEKFTTTSKDEVKGSTKVYDESSNESIEYLDEYEDSFEDAADRKQEPLEINEDYSETRCQDSTHENKEIKKVSTTETVKSKSSGMQQSECKIPSTTKKQFTTMACTEPTISIDVHEMTVGCDESSEPTNKVNVSVTTTESTKTKTSSTTSSESTSKSTEATSKSTEATTKSTEATTKSTEHSTTTESTHKDTKPSSKSKSYKKSSYDERLEMMECPTTQHTKDEMYMKVIIRCTQASHAKLPTKKQRLNLVTDDQCIDPSLPQDRNELSNHQRKCSRFNHKRKKVGNAKTKDFTSQNDSELPRQQYEKEVGSTSPTPDDKKAQYPIRTPESPLIESKKISKAIGDSKNAQNKTHEQLSLLDDFPMKERKNYQNISALLELNVDKSEDSDARKTLAKNAVNLMMNAFEKGMSHLKPKGETDRMDFEFTTMSSKKGKGVVGAADQMAKNWDAQVTGLTHLAVKGRPVEAVTSQVRRRWRDYLDSGRSKGKPSDSLEGGSDDLEESSGEPLWGVPVEEAPLEEEGEADGWNMFPFGRLFAQGNTPFRKRGNWDQGNYFIRPG